MTKRILAWVEPPIFHYRQYTLLALLLITVLLGWQAVQLKPGAGLLKMVPKQHPYMQTLLQYYKAFGCANTVLVALHSNKIGRASYREGVCHNVVRWLVDVPLK